ERADRRHRDAAPAPRRPLGHGDGRRPAADAEGLRGGARAPALERFPNEHDRRPSMNRTAILDPAGLARRAAVALGALLIASAAYWPAAGHAQPVPTVQLPDFSELAERVGPAVVNIRTTERNRARPGGGQ